MAAQLTCPACLRTRALPDDQPTILVWICECGSRNLWAGGKSVPLNPMTEWDPATQLHDPDAPDDQPA